MTRVKGSIFRKAKFKFLGSRKGENVLVSLKLTQTLLLQGEIGYLLLQQAWELNTGRDSLA